MKYVFIVMIMISIVSALGVHGRSLFFKATDSGWYPLFLNPVVDTILSTEKHAQILDIGTGPGSLPELLISRNSQLQITGIDIDTSSIDEARERLKHPKVKFEYQQLGGPIVYPNGHFDIVCFCSVLFLLDDSTKSLLMQEALRVLKSGGKVIVLSPSGSKPIFSSFLEVWSYPYAPTNWTFVVWRVATSKRAKKWHNESWLKKYATEGQLKYDSHSVFNSNATLETITKQ
jgi:ubiquinone/menaquinone biosynthesis C-methylase UbiE